MAKSFQKSGNRDAAYEVVTNFIVKKQHLVVADAALMVKGLKMLKLGAGINFSVGKKGIDIEQIKELIGPGRALCSTGQSHGNSSALAVM